MSRSRLIDQWESDLPGLSNDGVRDRVRVARESAEQSVARGAGRNPKAARMWRAKLQAAEAELERRGLRP
ncbi:hypothetical protein AB6N24_03645 [Cellulomonas sp. 179-A 4D5 NHS]|uniref:hypothetical protein n=1 Tax=Cellulomonas sp. 179-A 4D5 NHS TaxID=3142378 RepID=UPI0039A206B8